MCHTLQKLTLVAVYLKLLKRADLGSSTTRKQTPPPLFFLPYQIQMLKAWLCIMISHNIISYIKSLYRTSYTYTGAVCPLYLNKTGKNTIKNPEE